jgi:hypothetical protein
MKRITKIIGLSLIALLFCSLTTTRTSAATYACNLAAGRGAYTEYLCTFSNSTATPITTGTTVSYYVADVNMHWGYNISYAHDTHMIEGAIFAFYFNSTFSNLAGSYDLDLPMALILTPTSDAWWSLLKSYAENLSVYNKVTIGSDMIDVTWFWTHGVINETYTGSIDKDTGVMINYTDLALNVTSHTTEVTSLGIVSTNVPNVNIPSQPTSPIMIVGVTGICAVVGLVAGLLTGRRRA